MAPSIIKDPILPPPLTEKKSHPSISLHEHQFLAHGFPFLTDVPSNITFSPFCSISQSQVKNPGFFVGFASSSPGSRHVVSLGKLQRIRFTSIFRFKVWWTTPWVGHDGGDLEQETQMVILDKSPSGRPHVVLLPLIEGSFRASLQPGEANHVDLCIESGSPDVAGSNFTSCLYMLAGDDPYELVRDTVGGVRHHLGTFRVLEEKEPPRIVDKFGWCTWDAFYLKVHPQGVWEGVKGLVEGGCPPGLVLIDDGWQSVSHDDDDGGIERTSAGEQMPCRLVKFEENYKFRDYGNGGGMGAFVRDLKSAFKSVEDVYVWHALCGYWGGVRPGAVGMPQSAIMLPELSPGLRKTMEDLAVDKIVSNGVGLVPPEKVHQLYEGLHSHLAALGIDGVKVDVIQILEMVCEKYGGRVELAKAYYRALTDSVKKHFKGNGVIASMEHSNDFMFLGTEAICLGRVGDDFWCTDPAGDPNGMFWLQGCHMVSCAYNSVWMGNFMQPDWDMFQSTHPCARFHAASRAISGGPIYVSDSVGHHDFHLLQSLALPDGSILRCTHCALPTRDCLFQDPLHDGRTMLKIWNLNKFTGVLGAFNCQGGGWCKQSRRNRCFSKYSNAIKCSAKPLDIEWNKGKNPISIENVDSFAVYLFQARKLVFLEPNESVDIEVQPFDFELLTVSPVKWFPNKVVRFAPIGLINMMNTGGAIQMVDYDECRIAITVKGCGNMLLFVSENPKSCWINGEEVEHSYDESMVVVQVAWPDSGFCTVDYLF